MKRILGLDLGTNSIGWSLIETDFEKKAGNIKGIGSRIIPMDKSMMDTFGSGGTIETATAERTGYRGARRLVQRNLLRRERLHRVLNVLNFLPEHYANSIDFENHFGQFKNNTEVKLNYRKNEQGKHEFIFMDSFNEMIEEFRAKGKETKIPYDWTLYYLRKKALTAKISKQELAWVILNFNQKRGYYQLRGEEKETDKTKLEEFYSLRVKEIQETEDKNAKGIWYNVILENDWVYKRQSKEPLENWIGKNKDFIITTQLEEDGSFKQDKEGNVKRSFRSPKEDDWGLVKIKTQNIIEEFNKDNNTIGVSQYIYETLLENPTQKIRGHLVKTIERKFYKEEFNQILKTQIEHHPELQNRVLYQSCIDELYPRNEAHQNNIKDKGFDYLFMDDIIFYQRPLKSKKSTIAGCQYETKKFKKEMVDEITNEKKIEWVTTPLKAIPKSHPLFQEFRLWQFLKNLKLYKIEGKADVDITNELLKAEEDWVELFDFLNEKSKIKQSQLIDFIAKKKLIDKKNKDNYRWNYVVDKEYPCNETRAQFISRLKKVENLDVTAFLTPEMEYKLWHIVYSVTDKNEFERAIKNFATRNHIDQKTFEANFKKIPPYKSDYGAYSEKAIKKFLPLMRRGNYWDESLITEEVKDRIANIMERVNALNLKNDYTKQDLNEVIETVIDDDIPRKLVKSFVGFIGRNPLQGLNTYQACYAIYERHSEAGGNQNWKTPSDIDNYLLGFKQHSLRNPIVEQVVTETLRTVRDIWKHYGQGDERLFDEIHIELGREMKNPADKRKKMTAQISENENTNQRIKAILQELQNEGARSHSPSHQEILKIYEEGVYQSNENVADDIEKIRKNTTPTKADINKYKLWLEQGYVSPYTGRTIPLSKLFTHEYEIEHIIPQSRYFDNSLSNKVICESAVNGDKSNMIAFEYISEKGGSIVDGINIVSVEHYEAHCEKYFKKNRTKLKNLLSEDVPEGFINRQLNDSRYISTLVKGLLSNLVREDEEKEATSKHIVPITGSITSKLKQDWGLNDKWNELVLPRFERLNKLTNSTDFTTKNTNGVIIPTVPDELSKGFNKKRIDHRHHALDALIIACCTKKHTNYLGALKENFGLRDSLLIKSKEGHYTKHFLMPWGSFVTDAKKQLEKTIISFKKNTRVINKSNNKTLQWVEKENGVLKKELIKQTKGINWAIRKPLHKETVSGKVVLKREKGEVALNYAIENWKMIIDKSIKNKIKGAFILFDNDVKQVKNHFKNNPIKIENKEVKRVAIYENIEATATRTTLSDKFTRKQLESITDTGIQKILENHVKNYIDEKGKEQFDLAFNIEGVDELNKDIVELNNEKKHQPIYKVRLYEAGSKFNVGYIGNSKDKFVEAAKGTNLFFAIYWNEEKQKREYKTIPFNEVIEHQKQVAHLPKHQRTKIPINVDKGQFLFSLSPNDLVYVPSNEERDNPNLVDFNNLTKNQADRIYKMISSTGNECHFNLNHISKLIKSYDTKSKIGEFGSLNKSEISIVGDRIKEVCWKLKVDRLGNVVRASS